MIKSQRPHSTTTVLTSQKDEKEVIEWHTNCQFKAPISKKVRHISNIMLLFSQTTKFSSSNISIWLHHNILEPWLTLTISNHHKLFISNSWWKIRFLSRILTLKSLEECFHVLVVSLVHLPFYLRLTSISGQCTILTLTCTKSSSQPDTPV